MPEIFRVVRKNRRGRLPRDKRDITGNIECLYTLKPTINRRRSVSQNICFGGLYAKYPKIDEIKVHAVTRTTNQNGVYSVRILIIIAAEYQKKTKKKNQIDRLTKSYQNKISKDNNCFVLSPIVRRNLELYAVQVCDRN